MTRSFYFGTNFKMHQTVTETQAFVARLAEIAPPPDVHRFVIPPFTSLGGLAKLAHPADIAVGAQNAHYAEAGAYTGEISVGMLAAHDVDLVMIGHAERRHAFGESDDLIARKARAVVSSGLTLLLCVGETALERRNGETEAVLMRQLTSALPEAWTDASIWVAYEPVWSIGEAGVPASVEDIAPIAAFIRERLAKLAPHAVPLLYGGSVSVQNCAAYAGLPAIDGLFVGRAAWTPETYADVLDRGHAAWRQAG